MSDNVTSRLLIVGGGPAGYTAAIYAARSGYRPILIQGPQPGGQLMITTDVDNYPGFAETIQGPALMQAMAQQVARMEVPCITDQIVRVDFSRTPFICEGEQKVYAADAVILATGAQAKWLGLPSEQKFRGGGVSACATCDGFFFRGQDVVVIGGGNTAVEEALFLAQMAHSVTLVHRRDRLRAEHLLQQRILNHPKIRIMWHHTIEEIIGTEDPLTVTGVHAKDTQNGALTHIPAQGVFVAIGHVPMTQVFQGHLSLDEEGYIVTQPGTTRTSVDGIFAAGDVQDKIYRQAVTAAGQGCMAALDAERYLSLQQPV